MLAYIRNFSVFCTEVNIILVVGILLIFIDKKQIKEDCKSLTAFFAYEDSDNKINEFCGDFAVVIGPEGGFSKAENEYFSSFAKNISLSKTILRAEVASVVAVSTLKAVSV